VNSPARHIIGVVAAPVGEGIPLVVVVGSVGAQRFMEAIVFPLCRAKQAGCFFKRPHSLIRFCLYSDGNLVPGFLHPPFV
jgi:hypothetical protein